MKYKKIVLFFGIALPASILMRILELYFTVDTKTGFFKPEYKNMGYYLLILIIAFCAVTAILCFTSHRNPEHPPRKNPVLAAASFLMAAGLGLELFAESFAGTVMKWQTSLLMAAGLASIAYFIAFGVGMFTDIKIPPVCTAVPAVYFIARIICSFTAISSLALITDNVLMLAAYCVALLFFLCFGKLYNKIDVDYNFRKLMASGLSSVILCFTQSIPHIIINITTGNGYLHTSNSSNISLLITGIFIGVFTFSHFSFNNVAVRRTRKTENSDGKQLYI